MWWRFLTLWLGLLNLLVLGVTWALTSRASGYHLSRDFPDGVTIFATWIVFGAPLGCLATVGVAAYEVKGSRGRRAGVVAGLACAGLAAAISAFAWISLLRHG